MPKRYTEKISPTSGEHFIRKATPLHWTHYAKDEIDWVKIPEQLPKQKIQVLGDNASFKKMMAELRGR